MPQRRDEEIVSLHDAKRHLSELIERSRKRARAVTITRHGRPVARLVPTNLSSAAGHLADARGWLDESDEFFDDMASIERARHRLRTAKLER